MQKQGSSQVLESLSKATPLPDILMQIVRNVEHANPEMLCSILILNPETNQQQLDCLIHEKCSHFQGYFFQKPIPVDEFTAFIQSTMK